MNSLLNFELEIRFNTRFYMISTNLIMEIDSFVMKSTSGEVSKISGDFDAKKGEIRLIQLHFEKKYFPEFDIVKS